MMVTKFRIIAALFLLAGSLFAANIEFVNGNWFNGAKFEAKTVYVVNGSFSFEKPAQVDQSIDLHGGWALPPFGEAHNHNLDSDHDLEDRINDYFKGGIFYVKMQSDTKRRVDALSAILKSEPALEIAFAHGPFTGPGGAPIAQLHRYFDQGYLKGTYESKQALENEAYFELENEADLEKKWPYFLATEPDFVKCILRDSGQYQKHLNDPKTFGRRGLNPKLLPAIVSKAHQAGLRVSASALTSGDFHHAVTAGVDEITSIPGVLNLDIIGEADARLAKERGIVVITATRPAEKLARRSPEKYKKLRDNIILNLTILQEQGVRLAIGSDDWIDTSLREMAHVSRLKIFSTLDILKMWCQHAPQTIFPKRKIGHIKEGYEGHFVVLKGNPLQNRSHILEVEARYKSGVLVPVKAGGHNHGGH